MTKGVICAARGSSTYFSLRLQELTGFLQAILDLWLE